jgi:hypothetical protein
MPCCVDCKVETECFLRCDARDKVIRKKLEISRKKDPEAVYFFKLGIGKEDCKFSNQWKELATEILCYVYCNFSDYLSENIVKNKTEWQERICNIDRELLSRNALS